MRGLADALVDLVLRHLAQAQPEGDVVVHGEVRIERVALEDHRDVAIARGDVVDDTVADPKRALADVLEPGDHPERRRLAATGRPDQDHELPVSDLQVHPRHSLRSVGIDLAYSVEGHSSHGAAFSLYDRRSHSGFLQTFRRGRPSG